MENPSLSSPGSACPPVESAHIRALGDVCRGGADRHLLCLKRWRDGRPVGWWAVQPSGDVGLVLAYETRWLLP